MTRQLAKIIADSISPHDVRLTTMEVVMPRIVLAEFNTHRQFCLAGDAELRSDAVAGKLSTYSFFGNFRGWVQYRKTIAGEADILAHRSNEAC